MNRVGPHRAALPTARADGAAGQGVPGVGRLPDAGRHLGPRHRAPGVVFAYTVVGSLFFPFAVLTLVWLNNSRHVTRDGQNGVVVNVVLSGASALRVIWRSSRSAAR